MKDLRYLALFVLMALLVSCDLTTAKAPPLVVSLPKATALPAQTTTPPVNGSVPLSHFEAGKAVIEPNFYYDRQVSTEVIGVFVSLARHYPGSAKGIKKIIAVRYPRIAWAVNIDAGVIYVNVALTHCKTKSAWCANGKIDHAKALAYRYAQQAIWPMWKRNRNSGDTKRYGSWQRFAVALAGTVR
jgi:hypothetical protein